jgi:glycosyltransferase involved in cell wall biosynthesis
MKLCYISTMLAPFNAGGPGTVANYLLKEFIKHPNLEITLICNNSASEEEIINEFGDKFTKIIRISEDENIPEYFKLMTKGAKQIWKVFNDNDIVHINSLWSLRGFYIGPFASLLRKPLILTWHGLSARHYFKEKNPLLKDIAYSTEFAISNALYSKIIVNSTYMHGYISKFQKEDKICLIRNGVNFGDMEKAGKRSLEGEISLLFVGKLIPIKGVDLLLEAVAILKKSTTKDIRLYLAGTGSHESYYRSLAFKLNISGSVIFLGYLPLSECYSLYKSCTIFVSSSRFESAPMAVLEGMAAGAPIVATTAGGTPEIAIHMRNCLLASKNSRDIAEKILYLIYHPDERARLSENNLIDIQQYSWPKIASSHLDLYSSLI